MSKRNTRGEIVKGKRQAMQEKRRRERLARRLVWAAAGLVVAAVLGYALWVAVRPAAGQEVPVMGSTDHVEEGSDPGPFNSDPPTSGRHYADTLEAGFYNEGDPATQTPFPAGYLVHNLEHGYVIFWYNCDRLEGQACKDLKSQIQEVMGQVDNLKVIAFPWESIDKPVVMTSWGRMLSFDRFNSRDAREFVIRNRNKAPEPNAP